MKRMLALLLTAALLLSLLPACRAPEEVSPTPEAPVGELLDAALAACGQTPAQLERVGEDDPEYLAAYVEAAYGLARDQWDDCAVVRAGGASSFELAVLRLSDNADIRKAQETLESYLAARQSDFTGYAPDQAQLAADGRTARYGPYLALFICADPQGAEDALWAAYEGAVRPSADPLPSLEPLRPSPEPTPPEEPSNEPAPPSDELPQPSEEPSLAPAGESVQPTQEPVQPSEEPGATPVQPSAGPQPEPSETSHVTVIIGTPVEPDPAETDSGYPDRVKFVPPGEDDMSIYDTSAIRAAWAAGDPSSLSDYDRAIYDSAREVLDQVLDERMTELEKEMSVYGWLVQEVSYDWTHNDVMASTPRESFTPYGALVNHTAVCLGFATSFQLLMDLSGVECITVVGAAHNSTGDHAWNMVRLNGNWYCVDVTWDENGGSANPSRWFYFNVTSDFMARTDHQWDYDSIPEATATDRGQG